MVFISAALLAGIASAVWAALLQFGRVRPSRHMTRTVAGAILYAIGYPLWIGSIGVRIWLDPHFDAWVWLSLAVQVVGMALFFAGNLVERRAARRGEAAAAGNESLLSRYEHPPTLLR